MLGDFLVILLPEIINFIILSFIYEFSFPIKWFIPNRSGFAFVFLSFCYQFVTSISCVIDD